MIICSPFPLPPCSSYPLPPLLLSLFLFCYPSSSSSYCYPLPPLLFPFVLLLSSSNLFSHPLPDDYPLHNFLSFPVLLTFSLSIYPLPLFLLLPPISCYPLPMDDYPLHNFLSFPSSSLSIHPAHYLFRLSCFLSPLLLGNLSSLSSPLLPLPPLHPYILTSTSPFYPFPESPAISSTSLCYPFHSSAILSRKLITSSDYGSPLSSSLSCSILFASLSSPLFLFCYPSFPTHPAILFPQFPLFSCSPAICLFIITFFPLLYPSSPHYIPSSASPAISSFLHSRSFCLFAITFPLFCYPLPSSLLPLYGSPPSSASSYPLPPLLFFLSCYPSFRPASCYPLPSSPPSLFSFYPSSTSSAHPLPPLLLSSPDISCYDYPPLLFLFSSSSSLHILFRLSCFPLSFLLLTSSSLPILLSPASSASPVSFPPLLPSSSLLPCFPLPDSCSPLPPLLSSSR
ncbi:unnamed protein product [Acanthosepion pharaonis]|uniref:Uncharacterized protein n=1 Tax=Acanthosepion pharaonis TaxID=158019 RepID=A0A812BKR0_ACAPH|nr:unnamed protein product [Sepia pharaonis]